MLDDFFIVCARYLAGIGHELGQLVGGKAARDRDVTVALSVDTLHLLAEETAVGGGVAEAIDGDVIVDHLMEDGILDKIFRQVVAGVDTQGEARERPIAKEPLTMLQEGEFAQESAGVAELDRYRRQRPGKEAGVILVEAGLYVWKRGDQIRNLN